MRISDWSSDVCSSIFRNSQRDTFTTVNARLGIQRGDISLNAYVDNLFDAKYFKDSAVTPEFGGNFMSPGDRRSYGAELVFKRSEEHTSELQSLMRISYAVFCLTKKRYTL